MKKPVILDTDIGIDIDDTWALAMLLNSPELDLRLVSVATGDAAYRARLAAKFLDRAGRADVPVAVGLYSNYGPETRHQFAWVADYPLDAYPGKVSHDAVAELIATLETLDDPTIIAIGPLLNLEQLCLRRPDLAAKTHLVAMAGSIAKQLNDKPGQIAEWNILMDIPAARSVFSAPWQSVTITPLDTCGSVVLDGDRYRRVRQATGTIPRLVIENYRIWCDSTRYGQNPDLASSILFDTVAVHLACSHDFLDVRTLSLEVDEQGFMRQDTSKVRPVHVALNWTDKDAYRDHLVARLLA